MSVIQSLRVLLEADTSRLTKGLAQAKDSVARTAAAIGAVSFGFGAIVKGALNSADALQKMSLSTGVSVEALSALEHAASLSGTSIGTVERGIINLQKNIGMAAIGTKMQADAIATLGLNLDHLRKMRPEQQFAAVADALNKVTDNTIRAQIGNVLLGRGYRELGPLIRSGSRGMQEAADEALRMGAILSTDGANGAAAANDAIQRMETAMKGVWRVLATQLGPHIATFVNTLAEKLPAAIAITTDALSRLGAGLGTTFAGVESVGKMASSPARGMARAMSRASEGDFSGAWDAVKSGYSEMVEEGRRAINAFGALADEAERAGGEAGRLIESPSSDKLDFRGTEKAAQETATAAKRTNEELRGLRGDLRRINLSVAQ